MSGAKRRGGVSPSSIERALHARQAVTGRRPDLLLVAPDFRVEGQEVDETPLFVLGLEVALDLRLSPAGWYVAYSPISRRGKVFRLPPPGG